MKKFRLSQDQLDVIAKYILENMKNGVIVLRGDLASGKTTLVKAVAKELNILDDVTSPTFSLQQCYDNKIFHYDIYNHGLEHFISLGMLEELDKNGLHFIEWGDSELIDILKSIGIDVMSIDIDKISPTLREYSICTY